MTEYRKQSDGAIIIGDSAFRKEFPNTSIPSPITEAIVTSLGYDYVYEGARPSLTPPYESFTRDGVEQVTEWATYRQSLRDLPTASGWPHTHTLPTKPS